MGKQPTVCPEVVLAKSESGKRAREDRRCLAFTGTQYIARGLLQTLPWVCNLVKMPFVAPLST